MLTCILGAASSVVANFIAEGPQTPVPPSFDNGASLYLFNLFVMTATTFLGAMMVGKQSSRIWMQRFHDHPLDPVGDGRVPQPVGVRPDRLRGDLLEQGRVAVGALPAGGEQPQQRVAGGTGVGLDGVHRGDCLLGEPVDDGGEQVFAGGEMRVDRLPGDAGPLRHLLGGEPPKLPPSLEVRAELRGGLLRSVGGGVLAHERAFAFSITHVISVHVRFGER